MRAQGDCNEKPRPIQHKIIVKDAKQLETIKAELGNYGYVVTNGEDGTCTILHIAPLDFEKIQKHIDIIKNCCEKYNLKYQGWNARIMN